MKRKNAECSNCSKKFYRKPSQLKLCKAAYCSPKCQHDGRKTGSEISCHLCGRKAYKSSRHLKKFKRSFCSMKCSLMWRNARQIGKNHPNWKTGEYSYKGVLIRDKIAPRCALCEITDKTVLAVHHIDRNRKNNQLSNLAWLCHNCHFLVHHYESEELKFYAKKDISKM